MSTGDPATIAWSTKEIRGGAETTVAARAATPPEYRWIHTPNEYGRRDRLRRAATRLEGYSLSIVSGDLPLTRWTTRLMPDKSPLIASASRRGGTRARCIDLDPRFAPPSQKLPSRSRSDLNLPVAASAIHL